MTKYRYIDAELLMKELGITDPDCEKCGWGCKGIPSCSRGGDFEDACDAICETPTADVVEVVRCKDCKWHSKLCGEGFCSNFSITGFENDDYCSYGERRDDGEHGHTMEEYMCGQDLGDPEDGSL